MRTVLLLAFVAVAGRPAAGQKPSRPPVALPSSTQPAVVSPVPDSLLGRWEFVRILDAAGRPEEDMAGLVAFTFSSGGVVTVERTPASRREEPGAPKRFRYRVEGRELVLLLPGEPARAAFRFDGDRLVMRDGQTDGTATLRRPER